jgi:hypothetical protein
MALAIYNGKYLASNGKMVILASPILIEEFTTFIKIVETPNFIIDPYFQGLYLGGTGIGSIISLKISSMMGE